MKITELKAFVERKPDHFSLASRSIVNMLVHLCERSSKELRRMVALNRVESVNADRVVSALDGLLGDLALCDTELQEQIVFEERGARRSLSSGAPLAGDDDDVFSA